MGATGLDEQAPRTRGVGWAGFRGFGGCRWSGRGRVVWSPVLMQPRGTCCMGATYPTAVTDCMHAQPLSWGRQYTGNQLTASTQAWQLWHQILPTDSLSWARTGGSNDHLTATSSLQRWQCCCGIRAATTALLGNNRGHHGKPPAVGATAAHQATVCNTHAIQMQHRGGP